MHTSVDVEALVGGACGVGVLAEAALLVVFPVTRVTVAALPSEGALAVLVVLTGAGVLSCVMDV